MVYTLAPELPGQCRNYMCAWTFWDLRAAKEDKFNPVQVQDWVAIPHSLAEVFAFKPILAQKPAFR